MSLFFERSDAFGYHTHEQFQEKFFNSIFHTYTILAGELKKEGKSITMETVLQTAVKKTNEHEKKLKTYAFLQKVELVVGYVPVVGTIAAIAKLIFLHKCETKIEEVQLESEVKDGFRNLISGMKMRSWMELTSLGVFLIIPDIIATTRRKTTDNFKVAQNSPNTNENPQNQFLERDSDFVYSDSE